jgi:L-galactonate 5-dehydrogenase
MKAYIIKEPGEVSSVEVDEPVMGVNDILLDVHYVGLCGSDLNSYMGKNSLMTYPRIPGHEISGVVIDKGICVPDSISKGDLATLLPYTNCGVCPACRAGRINTCEFNQTMGVQRDGALTERISVPFEKIFVSSQLSLQELALVEPLSVGYHAANRGKISETDTVLILGCGAIGMGALCAAVRKGATVIAVDIDDSKLFQARKFGAVYTVNSQKENPLEKIRQITHDEGVSVAVEAAGNPLTYALALEASAFAGRLIFIGYTKSEITFDTRLIVRKELDVTGSRNALRVFPSVITMLERKEKPFTDMITKVFSFDESPKAFQFWKENQNTVSKILIDVKK